MHSKVTHHFTTFLYKVLLSLYSYHASTDSNFIDKTKWYLVSCITSCFSVVSPIMQLMSSHYIQWNETLVLLHINIHKASFLYTECIIALSCSLWNNHPFSIIYTMLSYGFNPSAACILCRNEGLHPYPLPTLKHSFEMASITTFVAISFKACIGNIIPNEMCRY